MVERAAQDYDKCYLLKALLLIGAGIRRKSAYEDIPGGSESLYAFANKNIDMQIVNALVTHFTILRDEAVREAWSENYRIR